MDNHSGKAVHGNRRPSNLVGRVRAADNRNSRAKHQAVHGNLNTSDINYPNGVRAVRPADNRND